jgi:hypothetical protein
MRRRAGLLGAVVCSLAVGAVAQAATPGIRTYAVKVSGGSLTLAFHGDQATGCAQHGLCDTSGTVTALRSGKRAGSGSATLFEFGGGVLGNLLTLAETTLHASVQTPGAADCTDSQTQLSDTFLLFGLAHKPLLVGYGSSVLSAAGHTDVNFGSSAGGDIFANRCAGPVADDYASALPLAQVKRSLLRRARFHVDLSGTKSFAANGFAGTVTSDLGLTFTRRPCKTKSAKRACRTFDKGLG